MSILSIPALVFFISGSDGDFATNPSFDTMLALTTIGNLGSVTSSCGKSTNLVSSVDFFCTYGKLLEVIEVGTIDTGNSASSCVSDGAYLVTNSSCSIIGRTISASVQAEIKTLFDQNCTQQTICTLNLSSVSWPVNCDITATAFIKAECETETILGVSKTNIGYLVVSFDIIMMFFIWIAFQIHGTYENIEEEEVEGVVLDGEDFTVQVANIPEHTDYRILKIQMWRHIETILKEHPEYAVLDENDENAHKIAQCNMALKKYEILYYFKERLRYEKQDRIVSLKQSLLSSSQATEEKKEELTNKFEAQHEKIKAKYDKNEDKIKKLRSSGDVSAVKIFITMQSMEGRERLKKAFLQHRIRR
jgi:hypothetical protein